MKDIQFILSVSRILFNYARKRRHFPPYTENPFVEFPTDKLKAGD